MPRGARTVRKIGVKGYAHDTRARDGASVSAIEYAEEKSVATRYEAGSAMRRAARGVANDDRASICHADGAMRRYIIIARCRLSSLF